MEDFNIDNNDWMKEAPLLASLRGIPLPGWENVPEGYFERFPGEMMEQIRNKEAWENIQNQTEGLRSLPWNEEGIPEGYFENLPEKLMERIRAEEGRGFVLPEASGADIEPGGSSGTSRGSKFRPLIFLAIAASIAILIGAGLFLNSGQGAEKPGQEDFAVQIQGLDSEEILSALDDVDEAEIVALIGGEAIEKMKPARHLDDESILKFLDDSELDNYDLQDLTL